MYVHMMDWYYSDHRVDDPKIRGTQTSDTKLLSVTSKYQRHDNMRK
jgi:hypothetical protein